MSAELKSCPLCGSAFKIGQEPRDNHPVAGEFYLYHDYGPLDSAARKCPIEVRRHFDTEAEAITAWNTRISHSLPGDVGTALQKAQWLNLMPREIVARAALNEGCRDKTANDIRSGLHSDVKIRAEVAVKLIGLIQEECFAAALAPSPCPGDDLNAEAYIRDWCPDHVKDYIAALTPSALSGDAGEVDKMRRALETIARMSMTPADFKVRAKEIAIAALPSHQGAE